MNSKRPIYTRPLSHRLAVLAASLLLVTVSPPAGAQRTMRSQWYATALGTATLSPSAGSHPGFGIEAGRYTVSARWAGGIRCIVPAGEAAGSFTASGSWLYRIAATRSRSLSLYGGAGAFIGIDFDDALGAAEEVIRDDTASGTSSSWTKEEAEAASPHSGFTYGLEPSLEAELFLARKVALVGAVSLPVRLATRQETLSLRGSAGIRINF